MSRMLTKMQVADKLGIDKRTVERRRWLRALARDIADPGMKAQLRYPEDEIDMELDRRRLGGAGGRQ